MIPKSWQSSGELRFEDVEGHLYIDRWDTNGEFYQGGCFLYFEGVIDAFEAEDYEALKKFRKGVPELKRIFML